MLKWPVSCYVYFTHSKMILLSKHVPRHSQWISLILHWVPVLQNWCLLIETPFLQENHLDSLSPRNAKSFHWTLWSHGPAVCVLATWWVGFVRNPGFARKMTWVHGLLSWTVQPAVARVKSLFTGGMNGTFSWVLLPLSLPTLISASFHLLDPLVTDPSKDSSSALKTNIFPTERCTIAGNRAGM